MKTLKIGVVGTGHVATDHYIPFLKTLDGIEIACVNRTVERARQTAERFGGTAFTSVEELAAWSPDTVLVTTREDVRHEVAERLIEAGAPRLFFEKPLVAVNGQAHVTEEDFHRGKRLLELAAKKRCETAIVFNYRFFIQSARAREIVTSRSWGRLIHAAGLVHYACWSHGIDLVHFFGGRLEEVTALAGTVEREERQIRAKDIAAAFRTEDQGTGTLIGTSGLKGQHPLFELILVFEGGRLHLRDLDGALEVLDGRDSCHEVFTLARDRSRRDDYKDSFGKSLGAYVASVRRGEPPPVPGIEGLRELQVEAALKRSAALGRPVRLQAEFPL